MIAGMRVLVGVGVVLILGQVVPVGVAAPAPAAAKERAEAARLLARFDSAQDNYRRRHEKIWMNAQAAGLAGGLACMSCLPDVGVQCGLYCDRQLIGKGQFLLRQDDGPRAALLAAVRAARKAIQTDPKDAKAHLLLARVYIRLANNTGERVVRREFPLLHRLRQTQIAAALHRAVVLQPDLLQAHEGLFELYQELKYLDLTAKHFERVVEGRRVAGPEKGETREEFERRIQQLKAIAKKLELDAAQRLDHYEVDTANKSVRAKATRAMQLGLADKALEVLLASDAKTFGRDGMFLELHLLLSTGRVKEAGKWLTPQVGAAIGMDDYHWLRLLHDAAVGEYDDADKHLKKMIAKRESLHMRSQLALTFSQVVLDGSRPRESLVQLLFTNANQQVFRRRVEETRSVLCERANFSVLRGLLMMERGADREAARCFRTALELWRNDIAASSGAGLDFAGRILAQQCLRFVEP